MKIIKVPYNSKFQRSIEIVLFGIVGLGFTIMISSLVLLDWKGLIVGGIICIPISIGLWKILTMQYFILTNDIINIRIISNINKKGFNIQTNKNKTYIKWEEIKEVTLKKDKYLNFKLKDGKIEKIGNDYSSWYKLIKSIPSNKLIDNQIPQYLENLFKNLGACKICGRIAFYKDKCLYCKNGKFNDEIAKEYKNEHEYIKEEQLELFSTENIYEKVDLKYEDESDIFVIDTNWKLLVTKEEVIDYSSKYYWD